jgi:hypothetical protein
VHTSSIRCEYQSDENEVLYSGVMQLWLTLTTTGGPDTGINFGRCILALTSTKELDVFNYVLIMKTFLLASASASASWYVEETGTGGSFLALASS